MTCPPPTENTKIASRALRRLPRADVTLQISLDSPDAPLHDAHRGRGAWQRAVDGIDVARAEGFRVRLAATVATDEDEERFSAFLDAKQIALEDRSPYPIKLLRCIN